MLDQGVRWHTVYNSGKDFLVDDCPLASAGRLTLNMIFGSAT